jgi:hypothetical protein
MLRKNERPSSLTSWQVQQLEWIGRSLRKFNRTARRQLRRIGYTDMTRMQYRQAGDLFGTIATRMIGALRFHHEVLKAEPERQPLRLVVRFVACAHRTENRQLTGHDDDEVVREALKHGPAYQAEIESLLELTNSIEDLVSKRSTLRGAPLNEFFRGINCLRLAVLQQQRHLLATAPLQLMPLEIEFEDTPEVCSECLKSKASTP